MENRLKSYSICPSLLPFLTSISILSLSSFAFFHFHSSPLLSRLSSLSTLSLPDLLFLFSYPSYLFFHSSSHLSLFPIILYLPFHFFPPCLLSTKNYSSPFVLCSILIPFFLIFQFFVPPHLLFPYISFFSSSRFFTALSTLYSAKNDIIVIISHR